MIKYASLFSGIGGFELGIQSASDKTGIKTECVFASEFDPESKAKDINKQPARIIYNKNFGVWPHGDITKINAADVPDCDIIVGGPPCQGFSIAGKREGLCGAKGSMFYEFIRIVREKQPRIVLIENVKGILSSNGGWDFAKILIELEDAGYFCEWDVINTKAYLPQNRERVFIIGHLAGSERSGSQIFPITTNDRSVDDVQNQTTNCLTSRYEGGQATGSYIIENKQHAQGNPKVAKYLTGGGHSGGMHSDMTYIRVHSTLPRSSKTGKGGIGHLSKTDGSTYCPDAANNAAVELFGKIRRLTPAECEKLQGFPDNSTAGVADTNRYKCIGNSVTVPVIADIMTHIFKQIWPDEVG